jgi:uncharacterized protein (TIGR03083 family)
MELPRTIELISAESRALLAAARRADPTVPVPCCPDWNAEGLVRHHAWVLRWWTAAVLDADPARRPQPEPVSDPFGEYENDVRAFIDALSTADPDVPTFMWWEPAGNARGIARHQLQEVMVHRWDAEQVAGLTPGPFATDAATDGVAEFCEVVAPAWTDEPAPVAVGISAAGVGRWLLDGRTGSMAVSREDEPVGGAETGAEIVGAPDEVVLALYHRRPLDPLVTTGDPAVALAFQRAIDLT